VANRTRGRLAPGQTAARAAGRLIDMHSLLNIHLANELKKRRR
jgi:hypothetical protein